MEGDSAVVLADVGTGGGNQCADASSASIGAVVDVESKEHRVLTKYDPNPIHERVGTSPV